VPRLAMSRPFRPREKLPSVSSAPSFDAKAVAERVLDPFFVGRGDPIPSSPDPLDRLRSGTQPADWDMREDAAAIADQVLRSSIGGRFVEAPYGAVAVMRSSRQ
jgi:hypothetical protein